MLDVFDFFRFFGILPYKIVKNKPVLCLKWQFFSRIIALLVNTLACYRGFIYLMRVQHQNSYDGELRNCIYEFLLKCEPMFFFLNLCVVYLTVIDRKRTRKIIKVLKFIFESKLGKNECNKVSRRISYYTYVSLVVLVIMAFLYYKLTQFRQVHIMDPWLCYFEIFPFTIQVLQFCVYFTCIISAYSDLENLVNKNVLNAEMTIGILLEIRKLRNTVKTIEHVYYSNFIILELNTMIYSVLAIRGIYDLIFLEYNSIVVAMIVLISILFDLPLQFYLMHLSDVTESKVRFFCFRHFFSL